MYKNCRHVMPNGLTCKSPAMRGCAFCYFHARGQRPSQPARPAQTPQETRIDLPPLLDSRGSALAVNEILQALAANRISSRRAAVLLSGIQMAARHKSGPIESAGLNSFVDVLRSSPRTGPLPAKDELWSGDGPPS
jgi:hypothetical protein